MRATARRRRVPAPGEDLLEYSFHLAVEEPGARRAEVRAAAAGLVEAAAAEARAFGAQVRCIHRLWRAAQAARTAARQAALAQAEAGTVVGGPWGVLLEPEHQLVVDVAAEVGAALRLPAGTAQARVQDAVVLAETLPEVLTALEAGRIGWPQAQVMVEQWREQIGQAPDTPVPGAPPVPPPVEAVHRLIAELLERAPHATAAQLRHTARARRPVLVAGAEERARRAARKHRGVWVEAAPEGMAYLHALLEAPVAVAVHARLEELAGRAGDHVPAPHLALFPQLGAPEHTEARSGGELRSDILADLLLDGELPGVPGLPRGIRASVSVMVPLSVLTAHDPAGGPTPPDGTARPGPGAGPDPGGACGPAAVLSGYGPISPEVARQLAAGAGAWHRLLTHPVTGVVLDHDRTVYTVPADLRRMVVLRDGTCRFPGCRRRAEACDLDHTVAFAAGGPTAEGNLAALCRTHHRIKHRTGHLGTWTVRRLPAPPGNGIRAVLHGSGADLEWISPGGLAHRTVPAHQTPTPPAQDPTAFLQTIEPPPHSAGDEPPPTARAGDPPPYDPAADPAPF